MYEQIKILYNCLCAISTGVTLTQGASEIAQRYKRKKLRLNLNTIDTNDSVIQRALDDVKDTLTSSNNIHEYNRIEIFALKRLINLKYRLSPNEQKLFNNLIDEIIKEINRYIKDTLSEAQQIIHNEIVAVHKDVSAIKENLLVHNEKAEEPVLNKNNPFCTQIKPRKIGNYWFREEELKKALKYIKSETNVLIGGIGGIGKTTFAQNLYYELRNSYEYIGWLEYTGNLENDFVNSFVDIPMSFEDKRDAILTKISQKKSIFFIDNVDERIKKDSFFDLLQNYTQIVVTSRLNQIGDLCLLELFELNPEESLQLFEKYYGSKVNEAEEKIIKQEIESVNRHTLFIELLAKAIKDSPYPLSEYIQRYHDTRYSNSSNLTISKHTNIELTMAEHVVRLFTVQALNEEEKRLLALFSIVDNYTIPFYYYSWISKEQSEFAMIHIMKLGWITKENTGYSMHPLVRDAIKMQRKATLDEASDIYSYLSDYSKTEFAESEIELAKSFLKYFDDSNIYFRDIEFNMAIRESMIGNFRNAISSMEQVVNKDIKLNSSDDIMESMFHYAEILHKSRQFEKAYKICKQMKKYTIPKGINLQEDPYFCRLEGMIFAGTKDFDAAIRNFEKALSIFEEAKENEEISVTLIDLISAKIDSHDFEGIEDLISKLDVSKLSAEEKAMHFQNMAVYYELKGDEKNALKYDYQALQIRIDNPFTHKVDIAISIHNISLGLYKIATDYTTLEDALECAKSAKELFDECFSEDNDLTVTNKMIINNLEKQLMNKTVSVK